MIIFRAPEKLFYYNVCQWMSKQSSKLRWEEISASSSQINGVVFFSQPLLIKKRAFK